MADIDLTVLSDGDLERHLDSLRDFLAEGIEVHAVLHGAEMVALGDLAFTCREVLGWDEKTAFEMLSGLSGTSTEPAQRLADLSRMAKDRRAVRRLLEDPDEDTPRRLASADPEFSEALNAYNRGFARRALRYEVADPSMAEEPVDRGAIVSRDDVFLLELDEARGALRSGASQNDLVRRRKGERAWVLTHPGPASYGMNPGPPPSFAALPPEARFAHEALVWVMDRMVAGDLSGRKQAATGVLDGIAGSPGRYAGLAHLVIDVKIGVYGPSSVVINVRKGASVGRHALLFGLWAASLGWAKAGDRTGMATALTFTVAAGALANGLASVLVAPPLSPGFSCQDIAHFGSLIFGILGTATMWRIMRRAEGRVRVAMPALALALVVATGLVSLPLVR